MHKIGQILATKTKMLFTITFTFQVLVLMLLPNTLQAHCALPLSNNTNS